MKVIASEFVTSATSAAGLPHDGVPQIALVGRSNVGKSSLINALVRQKIARTSAAPGKTRLINFYRVRVGGVRTVPVAEAAPGGPRFTGTLYFVDLPGYGYARGGAPSARAFDVLTQSYFGHAMDAERAGRESAGGRTPLASRPRRVLAGTILAIDSRHPGLPRDTAAHDWVASLGLPFVIVATKVDRLGRTARLRAHRESEGILNAPVLSLSATTGEGLSELWKLIIRLVTRQTPAET